MHPSLVPPDTLKGHTPEEIATWKTEYGVLHTLRKLGHETLALGVQEELNPIRVAAEEWKPDIVFNLLEEFHGLSNFDQHVVSYLELLKLAYTGCNPRGLVLARSKAITKKIAAYHRVRVPAFFVAAKGQKPRRPRSLKFPLFVKSASEEASLGISQASIVDGDDKLAERVRFIHESIGSDALVEEYIEGRELYVGAIGNERVRVLPTWELDFGRLAETGEPIATARVKHSPGYQKKHKIDIRRAEGLEPAVERALQRTTRRVYRMLELDGYARVDYRLTAKGELYLLEANPNPEIAESEEFASAAAAVKVNYRQLIARILSLGLTRPGRVS
ncbi:MAG: D-alanine--D-alanine ligase [Candidatus Eisenbacteria bacterium]|uniref:D-alanine--D-alanine ligase n=1 Tax=Eiseniibacteriota bacterium TaxID=2212470 RepID=A0A933SIT3_UNCEI|nr:D-alanine--D-alanine ligase [Candidatus Eisenbacteria bacterium]